MKKYHITLKDNETGDILVDVDTRAVFGAIDEENRTRVLAGVHCGADVLAATASGAIISAQEALADLPKGLQHIAKKVIKEALKDRK